MGQVSLRLACPTGENPVRYFASIDAGAHHEMRWFFGAPEGGSSNTSLVVGKIEYIFNGGLRDFNDYAGGF